MYSKKDFIPYKESKYWGSTAKSCAAQGICSICKYLPAAWSRGKKAYCTDCKSRIEEEISDKVRVSPQQLTVLQYMYDGLDLYDSNIRGTQSYLANPLDRGAPRHNIKRNVMRVGLEKKQLVYFSRYSTTMQRIYTISDLGRHVVERRSNDERKAKR